MKKESHDNTDRQSRQDTNDLKREPSQAERWAGYLLSGCGLKRELLIVSILVLLFFLPVIADYFQLEVSLYQTGLLLGAAVNLYYVINFLLKIFSGITNRYFWYVRMLLYLIVALVPVLTGSINSAGELFSYLGGLLTGNLTVLLLFFAWLRFSGKEGQA